MSTRPLGGRGTGRLSVLRTHVRALAALGHEVHVAVVAPGRPADDEWTRRYPTTHVPPPSAVRSALSGARVLLSGRGTLNEALFVDRSVRRRIRELATRIGADVVVLDSLRLSRCAEDLEVPAVVDLDDLLSLRYADMRSRGTNEPAAVLGFAATRIPVPLRRPAGRVAVSLLGLEARRSARRESEVVERTAAVSLVARQEVDVLVQRSGRPVAWLPPAVTLPDEPVPQRDGLVFLGGLDYLPNLQSLVWYRDAVLPHLDPADPRHVLHVVGACPDDARRRLEVPGIVLHGYVEDLTEALSRRVLVAPLVAGGGIKLKVLDGMAHGLPVVGTPAAFAGLPLPEPLHLVAEDGAELARLIRGTAADPARCADLGRSGRAFIAEHFVLAAASARWRAVLAGLPGVRAG